MDSSESIFISKGVPFWDDLFYVTEEVPHWGVFALLAKNPTVPLFLQIPVTYIFLPGDKLTLATSDKLTARLCTATNGRVIIRRNCRETPITFEMMESNMIDCSNTTIGPGDVQPYVCTVYARNSRPRIVTKQNFSLLCLFLRASHGLNASASYGRDEHARASGLFPANIMCVQAYVPLERPTRFISVFLKSPFATIADVYKTDIQHQDLRAKDDQMLTTLRDVYFPMSSDQPQVAKIRQQTSALLACIRQSYKVYVIGFVGEFVCDTEGRIYFTSILRVSAPNAPHFNGNLREWHPPHAESIRIDAVPKLETRGVSGSFRGPSLRHITPRTPAQPGARSQGSARTHDIIFASPQGTSRATIQRTASHRRQSGASDRSKAHAATVVTPDSDFHLGRDPASGPGPEIVSESVKSQKEAADDGPRGKRPDAGLEDIMQQLPGGPLTAPASRQSDSEQQQSAAASQPPSIPQDSQTHAVAAGFDSDLCAVVADQPERASNGAGPVTLVKQQQQPLRPSAWLLSSGSDPSCRVLVASDTLAVRPGSAGRHGSRLLQFSKLQLPSHNQGQVTVLLFPS
jgi:hypothetical protein